MPRASLPEQGAESRRRPLPEPQTEASVSQRAQGISELFGRPLCPSEVGSEKRGSSLRRDSNLPLQLGQLVGDIRSVFRYVELRHLPVDVPECIRHW